MVKQRTFVPEDLYRMILVGDPQISPDGCTVAFVRSHVEGDDKELRSHIWIAPAATIGDHPKSGSDDTSRAGNDLGRRPASGPRPYTRGPQSDSQPRWSPDGSRLAFVRQIGEGPRADRQIWIIERHGGEAYQLTTMRHGVSNPVWSPDGRYLAFVSAVDDAYAQRSEEKAADLSALDPRRAKSDTDRRREEQQERDEAKLFTEFRYKFDHAGLLPPRRHQVWVVRVPDTPPAPMMPMTHDGAATIAEAAATVKGGVTPGKENGVGAGGAAVAPDETAALPTPVQVTSGLYDYQLLDWSPDGRWIAVAGSREDERKPIMDIWLFPVPVADGADLTDEIEPGTAGQSTASEPIKLTDSDGMFDDARWSPDGRRIAVVGHHREYRYATLRRLWLFPSPGQEGEKICLTAHWDQGIGGTVNSDVRPAMNGCGLTWSPDGTSIYFVADDQGATQLYRVELGTREISAGVFGPGGTQTVGPGPTTADPSQRRNHRLREPTLVAGGPREIYGFSLSADGRKAALAVSEPTNPGDIYLLDLTDLPSAGDTNSSRGASAAGIGPNESRLTFANERLLRDIIQPEFMEIEFESHDGLPIHGWMMKPIGFRDGERYPAVLHIHGGPHTCWGYAFSLEMQLQAAMGYAVIFVNPRGSSSYGQQFAFGCVDDYGGADYQDLMAAVDYAISLGFIDESRLAVTGGSYGGFMTNWIVTRTNRFKAAISHRSISNWVSFWGVSDIGPEFLDSEFGADSLWSGFADMWERSPLKHARNIETPMLICHSEHDLRCPMEQAEQLYLALKWQGKPAELLRHPRSNHDLTRTGPPTLRVDRFRHIARFLAEHVPA